MNQVHDFDLNLPSLEELNWNAEIEFSPLVDLNSSQDSQNVTEIVAANNGDNEVHQPYPVDTTPAGSDAKADNQALPGPMYIDCGTPSQRRSRRSRRRGVQPSNPYLYCTNTTCRTTTTPLWRRGPLGPKTLCNACGIYFQKRKTSQGYRMDHPAVTVDAGVDASSSAVPAGSPAEAHNTD